MAIKYPRPKTTERKPEEPAQEGVILPAGDHYEFGPLGMKHTRVDSAYQSTANSFAASAIQSSVLRLEGIYTDLPSPVLYTLAHDTEPVGPRIDVSDVPEPTMKALAGYEWERRKAVHEQEEREKAEKRVHHRWLIGSFIGAPLLVILGAVLKALLF